MGWLSLSRIATLVFFLLSREQTSTLVWRPGRTRRDCQWPHFAGDSKEPASRPAAELRLPIAPPPKPAELAVVS